MCVAPCRQLQGGAALPGYRFTNRPALNTLHAHFCPFEHIDRRESVSLKCVIHIWSIIRLFMYISSQYLDCPVQTQPDFTDLFTRDSMQYRHDVV